ncbi:hypothetical protein SUNI508_08436 [Seiridium unicorne]|uniref:Cytochrome P450 n=1 Tax=Seiridium unicorne TaxID=138068 RepID=A0ABR2UTQ2_9PEZI
METTQLVGVALLIIILRYLYGVVNHPLSGIPGPWHTRWTSAVLKFYLLKGQGPAYVHFLHHKYGPIVRISAEDVDVCDPAAARVIHRVKNEFLKSPSFYARLVPGVQNIFNTTDLDYHRRHRRLLSSPISESNLKSVFMPIISSKVKLTIDRIAAEAGERGAADVFKWWLFMAADIISELSFGDSFQMLESGKKNQYIRDIEATGPAAGIRLTFPTLYYIARYVRIPFIQEAVKTQGRMFRYAEQSILRHKSLVENQSPGGQQTLFTKLYKAGEEGLSPLEITCDAQAYIIAGSDTAAITLTYLVWAVCRHPEVKRKLVQEVGKLPADFGDDEVRQLSYLHWVIDEALRLYCAAPAGLPRVVPPGGAHLAGHQLPAGATVRTQAYSLHREPTVFANPDKFIPERWENPTKDMRDAFMPFGGGSRVCIGMHLARLELGLATALFFKRFPNAQISALEGMAEADMVPNMFFLLSPKGKRCLVEV